ncbi:TolC family protein, partial [Pseudomonas aeruginosa]
SSTWPARACRGAAGGGGPAPPAPPPPPARAAGRRRGGGGPAPPPPPDTFRNPYYNLGANLLAPIFNHGRLRAERDRSLARQEELLETYRKAILTAFADTERSLNSIDGLDRQLHWQQQELEQAQRAFDLSDSRYQAGAETLLTVLETQRTLYAAQDAAVQLRLARLQASVGLYKALGGGWQSDRQGLARKD